MMPRFLRPSAVATTSAATLPAFTTRLSPALVRALLPFDLVIVPGLFGSGEDHWQSIWLSLFQAHGLSARRVEQQDWAHPTPEAWHTALAHTLATTRKPVLLIAHSLGAILSVQHGLGQTPTTSPPSSPIAGALLVAPADGTYHQGPDAPRIAAFMPPPMQALPFPATVVFSHNDPWLDPQKAHSLAQSWGASLLDAGYNGHIGQDSGLDHWPLGLNALHALALTSHTRPQPLSA